MLVPGAEKTVCGSQVGTVASPRFALQEKAAVFLKGPSKNQRSLYFYASRLTGEVPGVL